MRLDQITRLLVGKLNQLHAALGKTTQTANQNTKLVMTNIEDMVRLDKIFEWKLNMVNDEIRLMGQNQKTLDRIQGDIKKLESEKANAIALDKLTEEMRFKYVTCDQHEFFKTGTNNQFQIIKGQIQEIKHVNDNISRTNNSTNTVMSEKFKRHDELLDELVQKIEKHKKNQFKHYQEIFQLKEVTQDYSKKFTPLTDFRDLKRRFDIFSKVETIEIMRLEYLPKVEEFSKEIDHLLLDND